MDVITLSLAKKGAKAYTDNAINNLPKGVVYRGSVNYYKDLPAEAALGDCYTVLYEGSTGTEESGSEYVLGVDTATEEETWIRIGKEYAEATATKAGLMSAEDKSKLTGIAADAQVNTIETIKVNNTTQTITDKSVNITCEVPSNKVTSISSSSTDNQYPSAKCVYTLVGDISTALEAI